MKRRGGSGFRDERKRGNFDMRGKKEGWRGGEIDAIIIGEAILMLWREKRKY
jgi:hypothetical protein